MNSPSDRFEIALATRADGPELAALYASDDGFPGEVQVLFTRGRDAYASLLAEGDEVVIPITRERSSGRIVGMGACVVRTAWVNGTPRRVGYLTGLKALPEFRRRVPLIPQVYAFLRVHTPGVDCYYTTILSENVLARRMLERRRPTMPEYRMVAEYTTSCFRVGRRPGAASRLTGGTLAELAVLGGVPGRFNLAPVGAPLGLTDADVRLLRSPGGTPLAGCAVWDQWAHKQYVVTGYGERYSRLAKLPVHWAGYPRLPRAGTTADYVSIALLAARDDDPGLAADLLRAVGWENRRRHFVMVGLADGHPLGRALAGLRTIAYGSVLYTVHFGDEPGLDGRPVGLDVGLL
jgi:hypothetical protein